MGGSHKWLLILIVAFLLVSHKKPCIKVKEWSIFKNPLLFLQDGEYYYKKPSSSKFEIYMAFGLPF